MKSLHARSSFAIALIVVLALGALFYVQSQKGSPSADTLNAKKSSQVTLASSSEYTYIQKGELLEVSKQDPFGAMPNTFQSASSLGDSYIIELPGAPLVTKYVEISKNSPTLNAKAELAPVKAQLEAQHLTAKNAITAIDKDIIIKGEFLNVTNGLKVVARPQGIQKLKDKGFKVSQDVPVKAQLSESVPLIGTNNAWKLKDTKGNALTGKGIKIGIIDTGVDYTHGDLGKCTVETFRNKTCAKVKGGYDFVNYDDDPMDDQGHGTHVAAIAAGNGVLKGVAPDAEIYSYKVLSAYGSGHASDIIAAIDRSADPNQDGDFSDRLDVINLSLGGYGDPDDEMSRALDRVSEIGVVPVVAAGNSGPYDMTINSPGTSQKAITVGASDKDNKIAHFSSRGPVEWGNKSLVKPDVLAPGVDICAAEWQSAWADSRCKDSSHVSISGTSMAAPHVAGAAALLRQYYPEWTPQEIKQTLINTSQDSNKSPLTQGSGRIDVLRAATYKSAPPKISLDTLPRESTTIPVHASLSGDKLSKVTLSYAVMKDGEEESLAWKVLEEKSLGGTNSSDYTYTVKDLPDGKYGFKLTVTNQSNQTSVVFGVSTLSLIQFSSPLPGDIYRPGQTIPLKVSFKDNVNRPVQYSFAKYFEPTKWTIINDDNWDTASLDGPYLLKVEPLNQNNLSEQQIPINFDATLKSGWPVQISNDDLCHEDRWGMLCKGINEDIQPVVSDIDGDSKAEVLFVKPGYPSKLHVYNLDGSQKWVANIGTNNMYFSNPVPLISKDKNGQTLIYVFSGSGDSRFPGYNETQSFLYAFTPQGKVATGWPLTLPNMKFVQTLLADMDQDGINEILLKESYSRGSNNELTANDFYIITSDAKIKKTWQVPARYVAYGYLFGGATPNGSVVGNFDNDKNLEIVMTEPGAGSGEDWEYSTIHVYNDDGSKVAGWPKKIMGWSTFSASVADIDNDGSSEIMVNLICPLNTNQDCSDVAAVYAFHGDGRVKEGWPVKAKDTPNGRLYDGPISYIPKSSGKLFTITGCTLCTIIEDIGKKGIINQAESFGSLNAINARMDQNNTILFVQSNTEVGEERFNSVNASRLPKDSNSLSDFPAHTKIIGGYTGPASPVIADIDNNGKLDLVSSSLMDSYKKPMSTRSVYKSRWSFYAWETDIPYSADGQYWPTSHHDNNRSGNYSSLTPDTSLPTVPQKLTITNEPGPTQKVSWTAATDTGSGVAGYEIRQYKGDILAATKSVTEKETLVTFPVEYYIAYKYEVRSKDKAAPPNFSTWSTAVDKKSDLMPRPNAPTTLAVKNTPTKAVLLSWQDNSTDETGFEVWRGTTQQNMKLIGTVTANKKSAPDNTTKVGETYHYKIRAYKTNGSEKIYSNYSNTVKIKVK